MAGNKKNAKYTRSKGNRASLDELAEDIVVAEVKALPADKQLTLLLSRYSDLCAAQVQSKQELVAATDRCNSIQKSKDQLNTDYTKSMLSKAQLESLCRELQKQNKATKEENLVRIREEEEKRRDVSNRLNNTLADITGLMQQNTEKNSELRKENQNMATRLNDLVTQYEARQQSVDKILKQRDLQLQLAQAKLAKAAIETREEREIYLKEKKTMLEELQSYQEKVTKMATIEIALRTQLSSYADKYDEFQKTVEASNAIMNKFKKEMESLTKKIKKLEKETVQWQTKCQKSNATLIDMVEERTVLLEKQDKLGKQNTKLQQLARTLQSTLVEERKLAKGGIPSTSSDAAATTAESATERQDVENEPCVAETPTVEAAPAVESPTVEAAPAVESPTVEAAPAVESPAVRRAPDGEENCNVASGTESFEAINVAGATAVAPESAGDADATSGESKDDVCADVTSMTSKLTNIQARLAELSGAVQQTSLTDVTTKESTIEITEL